MLISFILINNPVNMNDLINGTNISCLFTFLTGFSVERLKDNKILQFTVYKYSQYIFNFKIEMHTERSAPCKHFQWPRFPGQNPSHLP